MTVSGSLMRSYNTAIVTGLGLWAVLGKSKGGSGRQTVARTHTPAEFPDQSRLEEIGALVECAFLAITGSNEGLHSAYALSTVPFTHRAARSPRRQSGLLNHDRVNALSRLASRSAP